MNPLEELRNLVTTPRANITGTVIGMQGNLAQVRTSKGIQLVAPSQIVSLNSTMSIDNQGKQLSVVDEDHKVPTWYV